MKTVEIFSQATALVFNVIRNLYTISKKSHFNICLKSGKHTDDFAILITMLFDNCRKNFVRLELSLRLAQCMCLLDIRK